MVGSASANCKARILELQKDDVTRLNELGQGNYGMVSLVSVHDKQLGVRLICAAKSVRHPGYFSLSNDTTSDDYLIIERELNSLKNELSIYERVQCHANFLKLIGAVRDDDNFMIITEYIEGGDLQKFLQSKAKAKLFFEQLLHDADLSNKASWISQFGTSSPIGSVTSSTLVYIALQIANALKYLSIDLKKSDTSAAIYLQILHRDIAARNILINADLVVKIADFGLARDSDYCQASQMALPYLNLALETLLTGIFTLESEVWQFGVLLFEIFSLGKRPYEELFKESIAFPRSEVLINFLVDDGRLSPPKGTPEPIQRLMTECFLKNPEERPKFDKIVGILHKVLKFMSPELSSKIDALNRSTVEQLNPDQSMRYSCKEGYLEPRSKAFVRSRLNDVGPRMANSLPPIAMAAHKADIEMERLHSSEPQKEECQERNGEYFLSEWVQQVLNGCNFEHMSNESSESTPLVTPVNSRQLPVNESPQSDSSESQDKTKSKEHVTTSETDIERNRMDIRLPIPNSDTSSCATDRDTTKSIMNSSNLLKFLLVIFCVGIVSLLAYIVFFGRT